MLVRLLTVSYIQTVDVRLLKNKYKMFIRADTALVLVILVPSLKTSKLSHHPPPHPHPHPNHHHLPHVTIGPYQPWKWDKEILTNLEEHPRVSGSSNGYQTNIIIDPFSQVLKLYFPYKLHNMCITYIYHFYYM